MKMNDRIRSYAKQLGVSSSGAFKNDSTKRKLMGRLSPAQRRRIRKKTNSEASA